MDGYLGRCYAGLLKPFFKQILTKTKGDKNDKPMGKFATGSN